MIQKIHEQEGAVCLNLCRLKLSQWRGRADDVCVAGEWEGKSAAQQAGAEAGSRKGSY